MDKACPFFLDFSRKHPILTYVSLMTKRTRNWHVIVSKDTTNARWSMAYEQDSIIHFAKAHHQVAVFAESENGLIDNGEIDRLYQDLK